MAMRSRPPLRPQRVSLFLLQRRHHLSLMLARPLLPADALLALLARILSALLAWHLRCGVTLCRVSPLWTPFGVAPPLNTPPPSIHNASGTAIYHLASYIVPRQRQWYNDGGGIYNTWLPVTLRTRRATMNADASRRRSSLCTFSPAYFCCVTICATNLPPSPPAIRTSRHSLCRKRDSPHSSTTAWTANDNASSGRRFNRHINVINDIGRHGGLFL